ncbi:MAG: CBS domain-containing protein [Burkholderiales bacterium]|nr:CBS domain-containing protein [Burkholderiales bacterium]
MNPKLVSSMAGATRSRLFTIGVDAGLTEVAAGLSNTQISLAVVCDAGGTMVGVITKTDLVKLVAQGLECASGAKAADVMTQQIVQCRPSDPLQAVLSMMSQRGVVHVPVVDDHSRPLGVVNARDAFRVMLADEQYEEALLRDYVMGVGYH